MKEQEQNDYKSQTKRSVGVMFMIVVLMFGFGFAMIPLYNLLCSVTGLNGSTTGVVDESNYSNHGIDYNREITVQFDVTRNMDLPWEIHPVIKKVSVHPGEIKEVIFIAKNIANREIIAQAIPGVTPWQATNHFNKTECFCFNQQKLLPGESKEMSLRFVIDRGLPEQFKLITLSYTFMDTARNRMKNTINYQQTKPLTITHNNLIHSYN